jgi:acetyl esterase/lipase
LYRPQLAGIVMKRKGLRRMGWILLGLVAVALLAGASFQFALARNGPAVLDTIDRMAGGARGVELVHRETIGDSAQQKILVYRTAGDGGPQPVLIFFHGGSWRSGNPDDYGFVARALAPEGLTVVLAGYRLVPGGEYPAMLEDTASAIAWAGQNIARHGGDPDNIFIAGHSAGAYNVVQVALEHQWLGREGLDPGIIKGVIGLSGPYDFLPLDSDSTKAAFGGAADLQATQPINHIRGDAAPMLLVHGEKDTLVKPRNTRALSAAITAAGGSGTSVFFTGMDHNAPLLALASPWRRDRAVLDAIVSFAETGGEPSLAAAAEVNPSLPVQARSR